jgi:hypothetical protein
VSTKETLSVAQSALAREYGFASWPKLKREVERRQILDDRDLEGLLRLLEVRSGDDQDGAMVRPSTGCLPAWLPGHAALRHCPRQVEEGPRHRGALARALIAAGAAVDGEPGRFDLLAATGVADPGIRPRRR